MSNYTTLGEDQPFEWNVVPLNIYLYGRGEPSLSAIVGSQKIKRVLEERYRENYLPDYCESESCKTSNKAEWREMVGATLHQKYVHVRGGNHGRAGYGSDRAVQFPAQREPFQRHDPQLRRLHAAGHQYLFPKRHRA